MPIMQWNISIPYILQITFSGTWPWVRDSINSPSEIDLNLNHYGDVMMGTIASQITGLTIVYSDERKHQSSTSLAFMQGIHRGPVNYPHKWPVPQKMFPFDDVIMLSQNLFTHNICFINPSEIFHWSRCSVQNFSYFMARKKVMDTLRNIHVESNCKFTKDTVRVGERCVQFEYFDEKHLKYISGFRYIKPTRNTGIYIPSRQSSLYILCTLHILLADS